MRLYWFLRGYLTHRNLIIEPKIIGGIETPGVIGTDFMASLQWYSYGYYQSFCGGSLIQTNWVLTAAHCLQDIIPVRIQIGTKRIGGNGGFVAYPKKIIVNSGFMSSGNYPDDIALIQLTTHAPVSYVIEYHNKSDYNSYLTSGTNSTVFGWGKTDPDSVSGVTVLRNVEVPIVARSTCNIAYGNILSDKQICAGSAGKDSCQGDSGGPLVVFRNVSAKAQPLQVGLVSFGAGCGNAGFPGVYTKVYSYKDYIWAKITDQNSEDAKTNYTAAVTTATIFGICTVTLLFIIIELSSG